MSPLVDLLWVVVDAVSLWWEPPLQGGDQHTRLGLSDPPPNQQATAPATQPHAATPRQ
jgi:hypothetical protein